MQAGAAAVIGTLWEVNDRAAALVVSRCYAYHLRGDPERGKPPMAPASALAASTASRASCPLSGWLAAA